MPQLEKDGKQVRNKGIFLRKHWDESLNLKKNHLAWQETDLGSFLHNYHVRWENISDFLITFYPYHHCFNSAHHHHAPDLL